MDLLEYLQEDLIVTDISAKNSFEVIEQLGRFLLKKGYIKESFINAVIEREKVFPTGIKSNTLNVAIPHADRACFKAGISYRCFKKQCRIQKNG